MKYFKTPLNSSFFTYQTYRNPDSCSQVQPQSSHIRIETSIYFRASSASSVVRSMNGTFKLTVDSESTPEFILPTFYYSFDFELISEFELDDYNSSSLFCA